MKSQFSANRYVTRMFARAMLVFSSCLCSCDDFLSVPAPTTELVQDNVFQDEATALAALSSVYNKLSSSSFADGSSTSLSICIGLYSDELVSFASTNSSTPQVEFYLNSVTPLNSAISSTWESSYKIIYECNRIIEGLESSQSIASAKKAQFSGEALTIRAFCHFYMAIMFGNVPLITTTEYQVNAGVSRAPEAEVYNGIIADLLQAKSLLSDTYPSEERVRINKGAATALLARAYLFNRQFTNAETQATELIESTQYSLLPDLNTVFLKTSQETIWQLLPQSGMQNYTNEGFAFILVAAPTKWTLSNNLYAAFETNDLRKTNWVGSLSSSSGLTTWYYPYKYKQNNVNATGNEYSVVLRLADQYLIRAEARVNLNKLTGSNSAESDINTIRLRAGLSNTSASTADQLLIEIERQRKFEFFTEWGHRFFDLKRLGRLDQVLAAPVKANWNTTDALLPIPQSELLLNQNLQPQNAGY